MPIVSKQLMGRLMDEELAFKLWAELGSLEKAAQALYDRGYKNPVKDAPYTVPGVQAAAYRWVLKNPDEAKEIYLKHGSPLTTEEWEEWLVRVATVHLRTSRTRFYGWLDENGFRDKYKHVYEHKIKPPIG